MALFKPKSSKTGGNKFMGVCSMDVVGFSDRSKDFDWADIFLDVEVKVKESDYTRNIRIRGSFDKDASGNITGGSVLNRMYKFFEDIGCTAGINLQGNWEDADGNEIKDIAKYLNDNHTDNDGQLDKVGYVYKEENKKTGKQYTVVHYRLFPNTSKGKVDCSEHINWMKTNGYLREASAMKPSGNIDKALAIDDIL